MGELILCSHALAAFPYYVDGADLNVYSLEELSYYIEHNLYLLMPDFMSEELCGWIERELGLKETAARLLGICEREGSLSEFVICILKASDYLSADKIREAAGILEEMEHKSEYECSKMRADRYMENGKYVNAIYEYRKLLRMEEEKNPILVGNVWHNLGTAYARLFLFSEAQRCFKRAYEWNENPESMRECLYACRCMHEDEVFRQTAAGFGLDEEETRAIGRKLTEASRSDEIRQGGEALETLFTEGRREEIKEQIGEWKETYRKNCRI